MPLPRRMMPRQERKPISGCGLSFKICSKSLDVSLVAEAQHRHKERSLADGTVGVVDRHLQSGPIHEELLAGVVRLTQHRFEPLGPVSIQLAELAALVTLRVRLVIFLPKQL